MGIELLYSVLVETQYTQKILLNKSISLLRLCFGGYHPICKRTYIDTIIQHKTMQDQYVHTRWPPSVVCWFIDPPNYN